MPGAMSGLHAGGMHHTEAFTKSRLQIDPAICHGKPVMRGTRVLVSTLFATRGGG